MTLSEIVRSAKEQLTELTGLEADAVSALERYDNGWRVTLDLIEMRRIPDSTDLMGTFEAEIDDGGNLLTYKRTRRYCRAETVDTSAEMQHS